MNFHLVLWHLMQRPVTTAVETWSDAEGPRKEEEATQGKDKSIQLDGLVANWPVALLLVHAVWPLLLADRRPFAWSVHRSKTGHRSARPKVSIPRRDTFCRWPSKRIPAHYRRFFSSSTQDAICAPHSALLPPILPPTGSRHLLLTDCTTLSDESATR